MRNVAGMILHDLHFHFSFFPSISRFWMLIVPYASCLHFILNDPENIIQVMYGWHPRSQINKQLSALQKISSESLPPSFLFSFEAENHTFIS